MKEIPDRTPEARRIREELSHDADALHALDAMAAQSSEEVSVEVPPLPDDLRATWGQRFGEAQKAVVPEKMTLVEKLKHQWSKIIFGRIAVTSMAVVALLFFLNSESNKTVTPPGQPVMRGGGDFSPTKDTTIFFIPSEAISFADFRETRPDSHVIEVDQAAVTAMDPSSDQWGEAVIVDAANGTVQLWKSGLNEKTIILEEAGDALDLSEALQNYLDQ
jgi:hypothetical protein